MPTLLSTLYEVLGHFKDIFFDQSILFCDSLDKLGRHCYKQCTLVEEILEPSYNKNGRNHDSKQCIDKLDQHHLPMIIIIDQTKYINVHCTVNTHILFIYFLFNLVICGILLVVIIFLHIL